MKRIILLLFIWSIFVFGAQKSVGSLYQISTIDALLAGHYDGDKTVAELKQKGDFGLGTFDGIDGEMVVYNGVVYHVKSTGEIVKADEDAGVPFASVHFFQTQKGGVLSKVATYKKLKTALDNYKQCKNYPCAFKITGKFNYLKTRAAPKAQKPYPPLAEHITKTQKFFESENIRGTLIGYNLPKYFAKLNVPGYHFHFLSDDKKFGGHVLELALDNGEVDINVLSDFELSLLKTESFEKGSIEVGIDDLEKVEKDIKEK
jgi:acetolactate decarboxylase